MSTIPKYEYTDTEFPGRKIRMDGIREFLIDSGIPETKIDDLLKGIGYWHCKQLATDGREESHIENFKNMTARLNNAHEEIENYKSVISSQDEEIEALKEGIKTKAWEGVLTQADQITALQSSLKEKEKECEEAKLDRDTFSELLDEQSKQIEELKAENERLKEAFLCPHCGQLINHP